MSETTIDMSRNHPTCTLTLDGSLSCSTSWEHFHHRSPKQHWGDLIWNLVIVSLVSFFIGKLMHRGLPTDDRMHTTTHAICSCCHYCRFLERKTIAYMLWEIWKGQNSSHFWGQQDECHGHYATRVPIPWCLL